VLTAAIAWATPSSLTFTTALQAQQTLKLGVIAVPIWGFSIGFIKLSVCFLLLRFSQSRPWRLFLYIVAGIIAVVTVVSSIFATVQCIPLSAIWDPAAHPGAKCTGPSATRVMSNFVSAFSIATDLVLSLFPLTFILSLRRPPVEKILIGILMGIGLTASTASVLKAVYIQKWVNDPDGMFFGFTISMLSTSEMLIGCVAASAPCLKSMVQGLLERWGVSFEEAEQERPSFVRSVERVEWMEGDVRKDGDISMPSSSDSSKKYSGAEIELGGV
jgi:Fungal rhodopsin domain